MLFNEYGEKGKKVILCMHGMCQDWHSVYDRVKPLENEFRIIMPAMDGFYDGCTKDFTDFSDQCRQIEEYVKKNYNGHLDGIFGISQGGIIVVELLSRGNIDIDTAVTDGLYIAHQGKLAGRIAYLMMKYYKVHKRPPKIMDIMINLMGLDPQKAYTMFDCIYWDTSYKSMKRNLSENYTYRANADIAKTKAKVYLWCGSKEPYAIKSHKIIKKYLKNYEEEIMNGLGHGEFFYHRQDKMCEKLTKVFNHNQQRSPLI